MADKQLNQLTEDTSITDDDILHIQDGGTVDKKVTGQNMKRSARGVANDHVGSAATESANLANIRCSVDHNNAVVAASTNCKAGQAHSFTGGYNASGITVPAPVIVTTPLPADGRNMTSSGFYIGTPYGTSDPVYEFRMSSGTEFQWRQTIGGVETIAWSSAITITGADQSIHDGVTVRFSTTSGWTAGEWSITIDDDDMTANRKWELESITGNLNIAGTVSSSHVFTDYAELFENLKEGIIPVGVIVSNKGRKVYAGKDGDEVLGIISANPIVLAGDTPFEWSKRWLRDEFGALVYDEDGAPVQNDEYDPTIKNVPRSQRPAEWSKVALLGQLPTRVHERVKPGDWVDADGSVSRNKTRIKCLEIITPYNAARGFAVALCLLR